MWVEESTLRITAKWDPSVGAELTPALAAPRRFPCPQETHLVSVQGNFRVRW